MTRLTVSGLALVGIAVASGTSPTSKQPPEPKAKLAWTHPFGHKTTVPCPHIVHPGGDAQPNAACNCPKLPQHASGDPTTIPCIHRHQAHPNGDDTGKKDVFGKAIMVPCVHFDPAHPNGDPGLNKPCTHFTVAPHPSGHPLGNKPCEHRQHPNGDAGPTTPCPHLLLAHPGNDPNLLFFTSDRYIQSFAVQASAKLTDNGINVGLPRKLSIYYREPINGNPSDNKDPFWSHYENGPHAIQLTKGNPISNLGETMQHEMGHAILGHQIVHINTPGGPHSMSDATDAGLAMSEGWAHFVGIFLSNKPKSYKGYDWENGHLNKDISFSSMNEFRVGCILWDLIDGVQDMDSAGKAGPSSLKLSFADLFRVYSPSLATLTNGPKIPGIDDFLTRLKKNHPEKSKQIDAIRNFNLTEPK